MKPLDKNKKYDLSQLNDEQLQAVLEFIRIDDKDWLDITLEEFSTELDLYRLYWYEKEWMWTNDLPTKNALELFYDEIPLKGFVTVKTEVPKNIDFKKELPNITFTQDETIYDDMLSLIEKGKQHGLKIVVTFEKL